MSVSAINASTEVSGVIHSATTVRKFHISKDLLNSSKDILNNKPILLKLYYCLMSCAPFGRDFIFGKNLFLQILCSLQYGMPVILVPVDSGLYLFIA
jgi:hypothetical protein